ncbi:MAG: hypothetical protein QHH74_04375 [Spirochaetota bacterium]|nr:hypothetical protein [Spirochaetota bacterium]
MKIQSLNIVLAISLVFFSFSFSNPANAFLWGKKSKKTSTKKIYVREFEIENMSKSNYLQKRIKEIMEETFQKDANYSIITDDDIGVFFDHESLKMTLGECSSDACIRKIMEKTNAEIIIYGRIWRTNEYIYITARLMDRADGIPKVTKIKTIKYQYDNFFEEGVNALAYYLLTGKDGQVKEFMDKVYKKEEEVKYQEKMLKKEKEYEKIEEDFLLRTEKAAEQRKKELTSRYSGIRIGWSLFHSTMDDEMNKYFTVQHAFLYDWIISDEDMKLSDKDYYDGYLRGFFKKFTMSDSSVNPTGKIGDDVIYKSTALLFGLDIGLRIRHRMYFLMTVFDIYFPFGVRFQIYDESAKDKRFDNDEINVTFYSCGVYGGCGLEIAFFKSIGLFMEYNIGYTPVGTNKINVDGHQVYLGVTYRSTSQSCCLPFL